MSASARVVVIARSTLLAETLTGIIESAGMTVVAALPPTPAGLQRLQANAATFAVIEANGTVGDTAALLSRVARTLPLPLLVIGPPLAEEELVVLIEAGCCGYVDRNAGVRELVTALENMSQRRVYASPRLAALVAARIHALVRAEQEEAGTEPAPLTARELQVLTLAARGISNKEIAKELGVWLQTVKTHLHNVYEKLEVANRREAIARAIRRGLIRVD